MPQFNAAGRPIVRQATERALVEKVATVRRAAGDRFDRLELNSSWSRPAWWAAAAASPVPVRGGMAVGAGLSSPYVLHGTRARLREMLERRRERLGISYYVIPGPAMESMAPLVEDLAGR